MAPKITPLLIEPFGPYSDDEILVPGARKDPFVINNLYMELPDGTPVSLNDTEFLLPHTDHPTMKHQDTVFFYGTLIIESIEWLTEIGKARLQRDLRRRDEQKNLNGRASGLTLGNLFGNRKGEGSKITVWIQGKKVMPVKFLVPPDINSMIVFSNRPNSAPARRYFVNSHHCEFWKASRAYMLNSYIWAMIKEIISTDHEKTPVERRTVNWLVEVFSSQLRSQDQRRRIISLSGKEELLKGNRHLRRITDQEVRGWFASAAEWILGQHLASDRPNSSTQILNIQKWIEWCYKAKAIRRRAHKQQTEWGIPPGLEGAWFEGDLDLTPYGGSMEIWQAKISKARKRKPQKTKPAPTRTTRAQARQPQRPVGEHDPRFKRPPKPVRFRYDADFSEESTDGETDSEKNPTKLTTTYKAARYCFSQPRFPSGCFEWTCPGCEFHIDLFKEVQGQSRRNVRIRNANDPQIQAHVEKIISEHYLMVHVERSVVKKRRESDDIIKMEID